MRKFFKKNFLILGVILFFSLVGLWALIKNPFYTSHDGFTHTARIAAYYQALRSGQFPARWAVNFYDGRGSPIFVYSYPLPYFWGSILHFFGISYQDSFRVLMGFSFVFGCLTAFWWLKNKFSLWPAVVGAVFYTWVPYRFLNLYVRAALAESLAYSFVPLVFLALEKWRWQFLALVLSAVLLSHNEVAALTLPVFAGWALVQKKFRKFFLATVFAFAVSAFIYLPDFFERGYVNFDKGISYFQDHFVAWWQLIRSHWGYGFDFPGTVNDDMSFQLGMAQIAAVVLLLVIARKKIFQKEGLFFFGVLTVSIFLMVDQPFIQNIWEALPGIKTIVDFPWRFLGVTTIAFAYLSAYLVSLKNNSRILVIFLLAAVFIFNRNHLRINLPQNFPDEVFDNYQGSSTAGSDEYHPVWDLTRLPWDKIAANESGARINRFYFPETIITLNGQNLVKDKDWQVDKNGLINLNTRFSGTNYRLIFRETPLRQAANLISLISFAGLIFWPWKRKSFI